MDINLELYKVFYYVATTLSFSEGLPSAFYFPVSRKSVCQDSGKKTWTHPLHPKYQESPSHT